MAWRGKKLALLVAVSVAAAAAPAEASVDRPVIGVLTTPMDGGPCETLSGDHSAHVEAARSAGATACFNVFYVQWLEAAGARVAVVPFDASDEQLDALLAAVDGVLFTGGGLSLELNTTYDRTAMKIFQRVLHPPPTGGCGISLWGTCMGFQLLHVLAANDLAVLTHNAFDSEGVAWPLDVQNAAASRMWSAAPTDVMRILTTQNVTVNLHHDGVTPEMYTKTPALANTFRVLSTNVDRKGNAFVSTIEAKSALIYGVQWHPERPQFEWTLGIGIPHTRDAVHANSWPAAFFVDEARKANHSFPNVTAEIDALIYRHKLVDPRGDSYGWYVFGDQGRALQ